MDALEDLRTLEREELLRVAELLRLDVDRDAEPEDIVKVLLQCDGEDIYSALRILHMENIHNVYVKLRRTRGDHAREAVNSAMRAIRIDYLLRTGRVASDLQVIGALCETREVPAREIQVISRDLRALKNTDLRPLIRAVHHVDAVIRRNEGKFTDLRQEVDKVIDMMNRTLVRSEGMKILEQRINEFYQRKDWRTLKTLFAVLESRLRNGNGADTD